MESQIIKIENCIVTMEGNWVENRTPKWVGEVHSNTNLVSVSFLKYKDKTEWVKSNKPNNNNQIIINLFNYDNIGLDIQFSYSIGGGINRYRTKITDVKYRPKIVIDTLNAGEIKLLTKIEGKPELYLYVLFIPVEYIKIGRNKLWHIKDNYMSEISVDYQNILRYGRKGIILNK